MIDEKGFVGLDVGKFEIFAFVSASVLAFSVPNTPSGHATLKDKLGPPAGQIIALEPTGGYEWHVWEALGLAGCDVRQISAVHARALARATGALAKTSLRKKWTSRNVKSTALILGEFTNETYNTGAHRY